MVIIIANLSIHTRWTNGGRTPCESWDVWWWSNIIAVCCMCAGAQVVPVSEAWDHIITSYTSLLLSNDAFLWSVCLVPVCACVCVHLSSVVLQLLADVQTVPGTPVSRPWSPLRRVGPAPAPTSPQPPNHTTATVSQYLPPLAGHCQYYEYVSSCSLCHYISPAFLTPKC